MSDVMQPAQVQGAPALPQVNLLPPSVHAKRKVAFLRVWLALGVLVVIFLMSVMAVAASWERKTAESELAEVQDRNASLQAEQSKYSDVPKVLRGLEAHQQARTMAMSTEVLWKPYLTAIAAATPLEVSIDNLSVTQDTVLTGSQSGTYGPLGTPGTVGIVSLSGRSLTIISVSDWEDQLSAIRGVTDVEVSSIEVGDDNGTTYFAVGATFRLTADAFANQFVTEE